MWWTIALLGVFLVGLEYVLGIFTFVIVAKGKGFNYLKNMIERHLTHKNWHLAQYFISQGRHRYPKYHYFQYMWGLLEYRRKHYFSAIRAFEGAKILAPYYLDLDNIIGDTYIQLERYEEAKVHLDRFLLENPENINARLNLAVAEYRTEHWEGALRFIDQVVGLDAKQAMAYKLKGSVHIKLSKYREALDAFQIFLDLGGDDPKVHSQILRLYRNLEEYEKCREYAESLLSRGYDDASFYTNLGDALCHLGKIQKGMAMLHQAVSLDAHQSEAHYLLAKLMAIMHHKNEALEHLRKAIADYPKYSKLAIEDDDFNNLRFFRDFYRLVGEYSM